MPQQRLKELTILIVDDDADILDGIELALRAEGATTCCAADGSEAISVFQDRAPDVVVLDMMLPKRSGFLVLEDLMAADVPPVVVMVTANEGQRHQVYARDLGVHAYLHKPIPLQHLIDTIADLTGADQ